MKRLVFSVILSIFIGCSNNVTSIQTAKLNQKFKIKYEQEVQIVPEGFAVKLDSVMDGRCPRGAECFWAGNARIVLSVNNTSVSLNSELEPKEGSFKNYKFEMISLSPLPSLKNPVPLKDYVAELIISKN